LVKHPEKKHQYRDQFEKMHMYEIKDRAAVLRDLKYSAAEAKARIKQDIEWENELFPLPDYYRHADKIVDYVFSR
jgi:hypothetical protein